MDSEGNAKLPTRSTPTRRRSPRGDRRFRLEICVLVTLKIVLLLVIKSLWFSDPVAPHMQVPEALIERQFFGAMPATDSQPPGDAHVQPR